MDVQLNTLFVVTRGATVRRDHLTLQVVVEKQTRLTVPIHQIDGLAAFGASTSPRQRWPCAPSTGRRCRS